MEIIPAIDLRGGRCVRLLQGDYAKETVFSDDPVEVARRWEEQGAPRLHVVDLDGAREGQPENLSAVERIVQAVAIPVELGGGIRNLENARLALDLGLRWVIVGTAAMQKETLRGLSAHLGDRLIVGIDAKDGMVVVRGWHLTTLMKAVDLGKAVCDDGVRTIVFTDISHDGMLQGPNLCALQEMVSGVDADVIASGGISSLDDIRAVREAGAAGAIIGMALYSGHLTLKDALEAAASD